VCSPGTRLASLSAGWKSATAALRGTSAPAFARALRGRRFRRPERHGKWLIARTSGDAALLFHFGMTGALWWRARGMPERPYDRIVFAFGRGELRYEDLRKLHGVRVAHDEKAIERVLGELGPDALSVRRGEFDRRLAGRGQLKPRLMNQRVLAGLGNLLVDEILWRARLHPMGPIPQLRAPERKRLYQEMRRVLRLSLPTGRVPPRRNWLTGRRDDKAARCPRCSAKLARRQVGGRTTVWCPRCQPSRS
jgi:formamidopyrimidine-DNA glycosylase